MVEIKLSGNWVLRSESKNWILQRGREVEGYYSCLNNALEALAEKHLMLSEATSFNQLLKEFQEFVANLSVALQPLKLAVSQRSSE